MSSHSAALIGSTGLVGSQILLALAANSSFGNIHAIGRKSLPSYDKLHPIIEADNSKWPASFGAMSPAPTIFFSALGTTRGQAGGFDKQRLIDFDLNLEMAKNAHEAGVKVYVLISTAGASSTSMLGYPKMKGELEEEVSKIGFDHTVILRPGLLLGSRVDSRPPEFALQQIAKGLRGLTKKATDFWAQDASEVGRAAVVAGEMCAEGKRDRGLWLVDQAEVVKLGRTST